MTAWFIHLALEAALRSLALAGVVGLTLSLLRVRNVPARKAAWTLVLLASFAMPLLMRAVPSRVGWVLPIRLAATAAQPATPPVATTRTQPASAPQAQALILSRVAAHKPSPAVSATTDRAPAVAAPLSLDLSPTPVVSLAPAESTTPPRTFRLPPIGPLALVIYFAVAAIFLLRLGFGLYAALRLWMTADRVSPLIAPEPSVRSSSRIASPVTVGSGIVLPADYRRWDARKLRMVMAHERSHVRQFDFYLQLLAGLYAAIFWFSPLGWFLRRTLSALGEAIGDRAGIDAATSRTGYASLVLEFAALPHKLLPGVAMARSTNLARRVDSMLNENLFRTLFSEGRRRAMASLLVIPTALFAVTALVRVPSAAAQSAPQNTQPAPAQNPPAAPATGQSNPPAAAITVDEAPADQAAPAAPATPPAAAPMPPAPASGVDTPAPAAPDMAPPTPPNSAYATSYGSGQAESAAHSGSSTSMSASTDGKNSVIVLGPHRYITADSATIVGDGFQFSPDGESWAIVRGPGDKFTFTGNWTGDLAPQLEKARRMSSGPFFWFTHQGKSYIVTDPAILSQLDKMQQPILVISKQQEELGRQQEALGKMQQDIANDRNQSVTVVMPDLSKEMADVSAQIAQMRSDQYQIDAKSLADLTAQLKATVGETLTQEKLAEIQQKIASIQAQLTPEKIAEMQAKLGELQARLGSLQGEAGAREGDFGARMGELGEQQGKLGEQQGRLGEEEGRLSRDMNRSIQQIIDEALKNGTAKTVQ